MRTAEIERKTNETSIYVKWNLDGTGRSEIDTGIPFMDHMLTLFARHGGFDLTIRADGDLNVDCHHTMEDLGLTMGHALTQALGGKEGIRRPHSPSSWPDRRRGYADRHQCGRGQLLDQ